MYQQDWIMRQIQMLIQFIARLVFKKDVITYEVIDVKNLTDSDILYLALEKLMTENDICGAENLLFERLDNKNHEHLKIALDFYGKLNNLSHEVLENSNFSKEEIADGLKEIVKIYSLPAVDIPIFE